MEHGMLLGLIKEKLLKKKKKLIKENLWGSTVQSSEYSAKNLDYSEKKGKLRPPSEEPKERTRTLI